MRKTTLVSGSSKNSILPWAPAIKEADGCIVSISSAARAVAGWPGIVYAGVKGMFCLMIHLLPLVIHQS
ncbi:unnamed protein product [Sphagnum compactum]